MITRVRKVKKFVSPEILMEVCNSYFDRCDYHNAPYTLSGLCLTIGYSREALLSPWHEPGIAEILIQARLIIEQQLEYRLLTEKKISGITFALKQLGWSDRSQDNLAVPAHSKEELTYTIEVVEPNSPNRKGKLKGAPGQLPYECAQLLESDGPKVSNTRKITPHDRRETSVQNRIRG